MTVAIRKARPGEGKALGAIGFAAWAASQFAVNDAGRVDRAALLIDFEKLGAEHPETIVVAEADGQLAGWPAGTPARTVTTKYRISGSYPTSRAAASARGFCARWRPKWPDLEMATAELETLATNTKAIRFYESHGFVVAWRGEKFSNSLGYAIDKVGMNKSLGGD